MAVHPLLLLLLLLRPTSSSSSASSSSVLGINYGRVADNLPAPEDVKPLLGSLGVGRVKLYDADPRVLRAFAGTGVEFVIGLPDRCVVAAARDPGTALDWVRTNVATYLPATRIVAVTVGNEVLTANETAVAQSLLPAMRSVRAALASLNLDRQVSVTTAHSLAVLSTSYPPSAGAFRRDLIQYISPLLEFLSETGSPFLINAYPYFAYKADPKRVPLDYVLFEPNPGVVDPGSGLRYDNMLHAQVDAVRSAIAAVAVEGKGKNGSVVELKVSETGWPSSGDEDEAGATAENAKKYNGNLMRMVTEGKGTPMKPTAALHVYVFALFNEDMKPGPASERHYGLFQPDGSPAYEIGIAAPPYSARNGSGVAAQSPSHHAASSSTGYYTISSAMGKRWSRMKGVVAAAAAAAAVVVAVVLQRS